MAVTYGFYDSVGGDRKYNAEEFSRLFDGIIVDGVFHSVGDIFKVKPGTGLQVIVGTGRAWFDGTWTYNDADLPISLDSPDVLGRIDAVVIEVNRDILQRKNEIKIVRGAPSTNPSKPILSHTDTLSQHALAYITVKNGVSSITEADIENVVGRSETPFVTGPLTTVDVEPLFSKWEGEFDTWFEHIQTELSGDVAGNLQVQIDKLEVDKLNITDSGFIKIGDELYEAVTSATNLIAEKDILRHSSKNAVPVITENYYAFIRYDSVTVIDKHTKEQTVYKVRIYDDILGTSGSSSGYYVRIWHCYLMGDCVYLEYTGGPTIALYNLKNGKWIRLPNGYTSSDSRRSYELLAANDNVVVAAYEYSSTQLKWIEIDKNTMTRSDSGTATLEYQYANTQTYWVSSANIYFKIVALSGSKPKLRLSVFDPISKSVDNFTIDEYDNGNYSPKGYLLYVDIESSELVVVSSRHNGNLDPKYARKLVAINYRNGAKRVLVEDITEDLGLNDYGSNATYYFHTKDDYVVVKVNNITYAYDINNNSINRIFQQSSFYPDAYERVKNKPEKYYFSLNNNSDYLVGDIYDVETGNRIPVEWFYDLSASATSVSPYISTSRHGGLCLYYGNPDSYSTLKQGGGMLDVSFTGICATDGLEFNGKRVLYFQKRSGDNVHIL